MAAHNWVSDWQYFFYPQIGSVLGQDHNNSGSAAYDRYQWKQKDPR